MLGVINKTSDIKLVSSSSTIKMMHGSINIRYIYIYIYIYIYRHTHTHSIILVTVRNVNVPISLLQEHIGGTGLINLGNEYKVVVSFTFCRQLYRSVPMEQNTGWFRSGSGHFEKR